MRRVMVDDAIHVVAEVTLFHVVLILRQIVVVEVRLYHRVKRHGFQPIGQLVERNVAIAQLQVSFGDETIGRGDERRRYVLFDGHPSALEKIGRVKEKFDIC